MKARLQPLARDARLQVTTPVALAPAPPEPRGEFCGPGTASLKRHDPPRVPYPVSRIPLSEPRSPSPCSNRASQIQDPRFKMGKKRIPNPLPDSRVPGPESLFSAPASVPRIGVKIRNA